MNPATLVGPGVRPLASRTTGQKIPCISAKGLVFTAWQATPEEIRALEKGGLVWLVQHGPFIPEMTMQVGNEKDIIPLDVRTRAVQEAMPNNEHEEAVARWKHTTRQDRIIARVMLIILGVVIIGGVIAWLSR